MNRIAFTVAALSALTVATAHAATPFDGTYAGSVTRAGGPVGRDKCRVAPHTVIHVVDGAFGWTGGGERVTVHVGPDGAFAAQSGRRYLSGHVADGQLTAEGRGEYCINTWSLARQP